MSRPHDLQHANEFQKLQRELHVLLKEIATTPFTKSNTLPGKVRRVEAIQLRMSQLRAESPVKLA